MMDDLVQRGGGLLILAGPPGGQAGGQEGGDPALLRLHLLPRLHLHPHMPSVSFVTQTVIPIRIRDPHHHR